MNDLDFFRRNFESVGDIALREFRESDDGPGGIDLSPEILEPVPESLAARKEIRMVEERQVVQRDDPRRASGIEGVEMGAKYRVRAGQAPNVREVEESRREIEQAIRNAPINGADAVLSGDQRFSTGKIISEKQKFVRRADSKKVGEEQFGVNGDAGSVASY